MNCLLSLQYGLHGDLVKILPYRSFGFTSFQNTRKSCFHFVGCTTPTILLHNFAGHSRSYRCFQFLTSILDGFFQFLILRVNEIDPTQFSCVFKMELVIRPLLLLLQLGILSPCYPDFWPEMMDHISPSGGFSSNKVN